MKNLKYAASGVLVVNKPAGPTSFGVIRKVRGMVGVRKVGHTGTLDPMATGVLPVCIGKATKLVPFLQAGEKEYDGRILLGKTTDTDDVTGEVISENMNVSVSGSDVVDAAYDFIGEIDQTVPAYSAVKIDGRPAYKLARKGEKVPDRVRKVWIHEFVVTSVELPLVSFRAKVSKGTYIRSLAADLGRKLGTGACLESLRRTASKPFSLDQALTLEEIGELAGQGRLMEKIIDLNQALSFLPKVEITEDLARQVANGRPLPVESLDEFTPRPGKVRIQTGGRGLLAVYEYNPPSGADREMLTPVRVIGAE